MWIEQDIGISLAAIEWVQAGVNDPGRVEKLDLILPDGVNYSSRPDSSLSQMLLDGEIDVAMTAWPRGRMSTATLSCVIY